MGSETKAKWRLWRYRICVLFVALAVIILWFVWVGPNPIRKKGQTVRTLLSFQSALCEYGHLYGTYPTECGNITNLVAILRGENTRGQNPKGVDFRRSFGQKAYSGAPYRDAWGQAFLIIKDNDGTNMVIRSSGRNGCDEGGRGDDCEFNTASIGKQQKGKTYDK